MYEVVRGVIEVVLSMKVSFDLFFYSLVCLQTCHWSVVDILNLIGNESVPIQLAHCWFPGLVISNAEIQTYIF